MRPFRSWPVGLSGGTRRCGFTEDTALRLKIGMVATSGNPPDETGPTDTQAVLVFREPNPREVSLERSKARHRSRSRT